MTLFPPPPSPLVVTDARRAGHVLHSTTGNVRVEGHDRDGRCLGRACDAMGRAHGPLMVLDPRRWASVRRWAALAGG